MCQLSYPVLDNNHSSKRKFSKKIIIEKKNNFTYENFCLFKISNSKEIICFSEEYPSVQYFYNDVEFVMGGGRGRHSHSVVRAINRDINLFFYNSKENINFFKKIIPNFDNYSTYEIYANYKIDFDLCFYNNKGIKFNEFKVFGAIANGMSFFGGSEMIEISFSFDRFLSEFF